MTDAAPYDAWGRATLALSLLAVDPEGLRGLWLRARSGPVRDRFVALLDALPLPRRKIHPTVSDDQLFGGVDLSATLSSGHLVRSRGLLAEPSALVLAMAERCPPGLAVRLGQTLDGRTHCLIAFDEGAEPDETLPPALSERLAFFVALDDISLAASDFATLDLDAIEAARAHLPAVTLTPEQAEELALVAAQCGIGSLRAPLLAMAAAKASAALFGRVSVYASDLERGAALVYSHKSLINNDFIPQPEEPPPPPEQTPDEEPGDSDTSGELTLPEEILLEAVRASLPPDVLARLAAGRAARAKSGASGTGAARKGNRRGRPLPSRPGKLDGTSKIDLVATLRAAAPWQPLRRQASPRGHLVHIRPEDIRVKRYEETSDRLLVFTVDASGSAAMARLGEAKGAIELLLAEAYARRDHVALIAFRGEGAELLLPPTRSLVQTKRRLAGGTANRERAADDATRLARALRATGTPAVVIDTATRPQDALRALAAALDAPYIALPRADAHRLSSAVSAALAD